MTLKKERKKERNRTINEVELFTVFRPFVIDEEISVIQITRCKDFQLFLMRKENFTGVD